MNTTKPSRKKRVIAITLAVAMLAMIAGTYALWRDFTQHKTNEFRGGKPNYDARLDEDFDEETDWDTGDGDVKKEIRVSNHGIAINHYGSVYVRIQLKEYMEIGKVDPVLTAVRYMLDAHGNYIVFKSEYEASRAYPGHKYAQLEDKVTGDKGWFVETKAGDPNGQYGKFVVTDYTVQDAIPLIDGSKRATDVSPATHNHLPGTTEECKYPIHAWDNGKDKGYTPNPAAAAFGGIRDYVQWNLNNTDIVFLSDLLKDPAWSTGNYVIQKWIIDDTNDDGYIYWGAPLETESETPNFMNSVRLIKDVDGDFYYAIHVEMEAVALDNLTSIDGKPRIDWSNADEKIIDSFVKNPASLTATPALKTGSVYVGTTYNPYQAIPGLKFTAAPNPNSKISWVSSNPDVATVDVTTGIVTGIAASATPVTIAAVAANGASASYKLYVLEEGQTAPQETTVVQETTVPQQPTTVPPATNPTVDKNVIETKDGSKVFGVDKPASVVSDGTNIRYSNEDEPEYATVAISNIINESIADLKVVSSANVKIVNGNLVIDEFPIKDDVNAFLAADKDHTYSVTGIPPAKTAYTRPITVELTSGTRSTGPITINISFSGVWVG